MMQNMQDLVREFHKKNGFPVNNMLLDKDGPLRKPKWVLWFIKIIGYQLLILGRISVWLDKLTSKLNCNDSRVFRCHILVDELGETLVAISNNDEIETADGLADLTYVLLGAAVIHNIPLETVFREVHRSNMTKGFHRGKEGRVTGLYRSDTYSPPNIEAAIIVGRQVGDGGTTRLTKEVLKDTFEEDLKNLVCDELKEGNFEDISEEERYFKDEEN
jgi:phosphoribosyl-ATP pyrophosphohydrolase